MEKRYGERDEERNKERCGGIRKKNGRERKRIEKNRKGQEATATTATATYAFIIYYNIKIKL